MSNMFLKSPVESLQDMGAVRARARLEAGAPFTPSQPSGSLFIFFSSRRDSLSYSPNVEQSQSFCRAIKQIHLPKKHR